jgi:hypothetical protein
MVATKFGLVLHLALVQLGGDSLDRSLSSDDLIGEKIECISSRQMAYGLGVRCYYNCAGNLRSVYIPSATLCPLTMDETEFN